MSFVLRLMTCRRRLLRYLMLSLPGNRLKTPKLRQALPRLVEERPIAVRLTTTPAAAPPVAVATAVVIPVVALTCAVADRTVTTQTTRSMRMTLTVGGITRFNPIQMVTIKQQKRSFRESL